MPTQKTGGVKAVKTKGARELWLNAVKTRTGTINTGTRKPGYPGKRTPEEYWTDTLRKSGGLTTDGAGMDSFTGLKKPGDAQMAYLSTPHFMRQMAGTEKPKRSSYDPSVRASHGTPAYKSPEEYYDETLALKKQVTALNADNSTLKARLRRLEDSHLKKEKEIDQLLDPSRSEEMRRTLADKRPDAGATIHSLKQKILRLEQQLRDKESMYTKLQSDMKCTKVEEMKLQMDAFYGEIVRLQNIKAGELAKSQRPQTAQPSGGTKENTAKIKALNDTVLRMNDKNVRLTQENKSLREDLEKMFEEQERQKATQDEYEDMNKKQLLAAVTKLEQRLEKTESDNQSVCSEIDTRSKETEGKIKLEGSMAQKLDRLDKRETELLAELEKTTKSAKKLRDDRVHYRKQCEEKEKEIKRLRKDIDEMQSELQSFYDKDKHATPRISPRRPKVSRRDSKESVVSHTSARSESRAEAERERERQRKIEDFQKNRAAKNIQKGWKDRQRRKDDEEEERKVRDYLQNRSATKIQRSWRAHHELDKETRWRKQRDVKVRAFTEDRAARKIQNEWLNHQSRKYESDLDDAAETIQSAMRGHKTRQKQINRPRTPTPRREIDYDDESGDEAVETIQSAFRGHKTRSEQIRRPPSRSSVRSRTSDNEEEDDDDDAVTTIQSAVRGHLARQQNKVRSSTVDLSTEMIDEDDDDDIVLPGQSTNRNNSNDNLLENRTPSICIESDAEDDDEAIITIQSAVRGHMTRKQYNSVSSSPRVSSARRSSRGKLDSAGEEVEDEESDDMVVTSSRRSLSHKSPRQNEDDPHSARRPSSGRRSPRYEEDDIRSSRRSLSGRKSPYADEDTISSARRSSSARKSSRDETVSSARRPSSARKSPVSFSRTSLSKESPRQSSRKASKADVKAKEEEEETDDDDDICF